MIRLFSLSNSALLPTFPAVDEDGQLFDKQSEIVHFCAFVFCLLAKCFERWLVFPLLLLRVSLHLITFSASIRFKCSHTLGICLLPVMMCFSHCIEGQRRTQKQFAILLFFPWRSYFVTSKVTIAEPITLDFIDTPGIYFCLIGFRLQPDIRGHPSQPYCDT